MLLQRKNICGDIYSFLWCASLLIFLPVQNTNAKEILYTYDLNYRLATSLYDNNVCISYLYDENGNRVSQINTVGSAPVTATWGTGKWGCFQWLP